MGTVSVDLEAESGDRPVLRFAPSPNGWLHLGHALAALTVDAFASRLGGRFLLRIEDIDPVRSTEPLVHGIFDDLEWLGLRWETPVLRQSTRLAAYQAAAQRLAAMDLLYPCFASRAEIAAAASPEARDPDGAPLYPGLHRGLTAAEVARRQAEGQPFAIRIDMRRAVEVARQKRGGAPMTFTAFEADGSTRSQVADPSRWGDAVIQRKDVPTSYHLAVVVDDAFQGVTHVVRGRDLLAATDIHRLLQVLLGLPEPRYHHHRLIAGIDGRKLSKSAGDRSLRSLRASGATPIDIRRMVSWPDA